MKISEHSDSSEMVTSTRVMMRSARAARRPTRICCSGPSLLRPDGEKSTCDADQRPDHEQVGQAVHEEHQRRAAE